MLTGSRIYEYVVKTTELIAAVMRPGQLISLESTTYPGTTDEVMQPLLPTKSPGRQRLLSGVFTGERRPG